MIQEMGCDFRERNNFDYRGCQKTQVPCALFVKDNFFLKFVAITYFFSKVSITVRSEISDML